MEDVVTRIRTIMEKEGLSPASFADALGIGRPLMSHVLGGRNNPSLQLVMKILEHFPAYSADWLVRGVENESVLAPAAEPANQLFSFSPPAPAMQPENSFTGQAPLPEKSVSKSALQRTMLFYADGTFEEYKPRK
jgi:transcriptional regulator with XRE-family HTH domain